MAYHIEGKDIVIDGFQDGIAENPYAGISDMRNINIISIPQEISVNFSTITATLASVSGTLASADAGTNIVTVSGLTGTLANGQALVFAGAGLPTGVTAGTTYWVGNLSGLTFKLYSDAGLSSVLDITSDGTGTFASIDMGKPTGRAYDNDLDTYYIIDLNGRVWKFFSDSFRYMNNTTLTNGVGNGIVYYRGYIFVFRSALIDYMKTSTSAWTYGWQTMNSAAGSGNSHFALVAQDDTVYYCDGAYVGSFFKKTNGPPDTIVFDPTSGATYTWNKQALAIPSTDIAQCLAELGITLMIGGKLNAIYPWDRVATTFNYPILLAENFIYRMVTVNTNTYVFVGNRGRIYITNGSQARLYVKVPDHLSFTVEPYFQWGDANYLKNQLFFGVSCKSNAGSVINQYGGMWAIDLDTKAIRLANQLSYGTYAGLATVILPIYTTPGGSPAGTGIYIGWDSGASTYGMDVTSVNPYTGGQSYVISDMIPIGTLLKPKTSHQLEYKLSSPLLASETIQLLVASYWGQSFTSAGTTTGSGSATILSDNFPMPIERQQWILVKAILTAKTSSPSFNRITQLRIIEN